MARSKSATVVYVSLCPTEKEFALATVDGAAARVSLADGAFLPWRGQRGDHPGYVPIVYSPDGLSFAFATVESPLVLFDSLSGRPVRTFPGARTDLRSLAFSRDGKVIANGHYNEIQIWDVASGDLVT
jgi:WD40 repeat protein